MRCQFASVLSSTKLTHNQVNKGMVNEDGAEGRRAAATVVGRARRSPWPALSVEEALHLVEDHVSVLGGTRKVAITNVKAGDVLSEDVVATKAHPQVRTSVMDGYAVVAADGKGSRKVIAGTTAGALASMVLLPGTTCRVNTGSMIPDGADAVIQVEDTRLVEHNDIEEVSVEILCEPKAGQYIREIGSDIKMGELLLSRGCVVGAAEKGILCASERKYVSLFQKPRVSVMSTGHEVVDSGSNVCPLGSIRDTNRPQLISLIKEHHFKPIDIGIVPDDVKKIREGLEAALTLSNVVVCSGGVSMGEKDYLKDVLQHQLNFMIKFGRVWMKPGLPTTFAVGRWNHEEKLIFALPGNPVSAWVTAHLFLLPALKKMAGWAQHQYTVISVRVCEALQLDSRPEYRRAWLQPDPGNLPRAVCLEKNQMSSRLLSVRNANLLLRLPPRSDAKSTVQKDEIVDALVVGPL